MTMLNRKLVRDLSKMKSQALAIVMVFSCGVAIFTMSLCTLASLSGARTGYYGRTGFADVFAHVKRAPRSLEERIREIDGVARAETRVVMDVNLDVPGLAEPATGRIISLPDFADPTLNRPYLRRGRLPEVGRDDEVVACEAFTDAHGLRPGGRVSAVINGRLQGLTIVGIGLSPEYIYQIRPGEMLPDDRRFGVFWMRYRSLADAFSMEGAFNDVSIALLPGAREDDVIERLDRVLEPYGSAGAFGRKDQTSNKYVSDELRQLTAMAVLPPSIFLSVSAFLVNMVLGRIVRTQREQIAALKAFGYTNAQVAVHYLKLVLILALLGSAVGVALGYALGQHMTRMYTQFFRFPEISFRLDPRVVCAGVVLSAGMGAIGALVAVRKAASLPPAEAMRPEPPPDYRPTVFERAGLARLLSGLERMILRKLRSHPFRAAMTSAGIAMAVAVLVLGRFSIDAIDEMMDFEFRRTQREDLTVTLVEPTSARAAFDMTHLPGVLASEPMRAVPARIRSRNIERRAAVQGLEPRGSLYRVLDQSGRQVELPPEGLVLSEKLAEVLGVVPGDRVVLEALEGERPVREVPVSATVHGYVGTAAYMSRPALNRFMSEGDSISGAFLSVDPAARDTLYRTLKDTPRVAGVTVKAAAIETFRRTIAENILMMRAINLFFATIIAVGVVYNAARITLAERERELASMRVLGFTRAEVSYVLLGELALLVACAIPIGLCMGVGLVSLIIRLLATESYTVPLVILPATFGYAAGVVILASLASSLAVRRSVDRLDLIAVLKSA